LDKCMARKIAGEEKNKTQYHEILKRNGEVK
jgi:hypothetical protein